MDTKTFDAMLAELDEMLAWLTAHMRRDELRVTRPTFDISRIVYHPSSS